VKITHTEARAGDFGGKEVSSERALRELGWRASTPFDEGVRRYVAWREANEPVLGAPVVQPEPLDVRRPVWRDRLRLPALVPSPRRALSMAAVAASLGWGVMSDDSFSMLAKVFGGGPTTSVHTTRPVVGVVIDAPQSLAANVANQLKSDGGTASIGLSGKLDAGTLAAIRRAGSDPLPRLKPGGPIRWMGTRSQVKHLARGLGVTGHIYYEAPTKGFTYTQNLLAHTAGASALRGQLRVAGTGPIGHIDRGDIIQVTLTESSWRDRLAALCSQLHARHLHAVPADDLIRQKA